jgi:hypothetical protein
MQHRPKCEGRYGVNVPSPLQTSASHPPPGCEWAGWAWVGVGGRGVDGHGGEVRWGGANGCEWASRIPNFPPLKRRSTRARGEEV